MFHRIHKSTVPHTNYKQLELDMARWDNVMQTLRYIMDGGECEDSRNGPNFPGLSTLAEDKRLRLLFSTMYFTGAMETTRINERDVDNMDDNINYNIAMDDNVEGNDTEDMPEEGNVYVSRNNPLFNILNVKSCIFHLEKLKCHSWCRTFMFVNVGHSRPLEIRASSQM